MLLQQPVLAEQCHDKGLRRRLLRPYPCRSSVACSDSSPQRGEPEKHLLGDVKLELHDVAVLHHVVAAFLAELAFLLDGHHGTIGGHEVVIGDDVGLDEAPFKIGVDDAGRLRGGPALVDLPGCLLYTSPSPRDRG